MSEKRVGAVFAWYDLWVGVYIDTRKKRIYFMLLMVGFWFKYQAWYLGQDGVRDPDAPCESFRKGDSLFSPNCETDGHYLCDKCVNSKPHRKRVLREFWKRRTREMREEEARR